MQKVSQLGILYRILLNLYQLLGLVFYTIAPIYLYIRIKNGKESHLRWKERLGYATKARPNNQKLIWFHAASLGEFKSILPIINIIHEKKPNLTILITTCTRTSEQLFQEQEISKAKNVIHQFVPIDTKHAVKLFLKHWKIDLAIFVDSEIWPNLVTLTSQQTKLILINARISNKSFERWMNVKPILCYLLEHFNTIIPCSKSDYKKFEELGDSKINNKLKYLGHLKYFQTTITKDNVKTNLSAHKPRFEEIKKMIMRRDVIVFASTHSPEEEMLLAVSLRLQKKFPNLLTIIVPRHPVRGVGEIVPLLNTKHINYAVRSLDQVITTDVSVYIADTIGELNSFYTLADAIFIGGSLIDHGGQNIIEAINSLHPSIIGPYYHNFYDIVTEAVENNVAFVVQNTEELEKTLTKILSDPSLQKEYASKAKKFIASHEYNMEEMIKIIETNLKK